MNAESGDLTGGLLLAGLDASNPLSFLAALGTLRTLTIVWPDHPVRMRWIDHAGAWRPVVTGNGLSDHNAAVVALDRQLQHMVGHLALRLGDDLSVSPAEFRDFARLTVEAAERSSDTDRRTGVDFAAAFACDALANQQGKVQDTALRTMSGAGHQHFLASMRRIVEQTKPHHLYKALFQPWRYDDPMAGQTLRWDPADDSRYALQWRDPSGDPRRSLAGAMLGANRLAIEAIPLIYSAPVNSTLRTVGFVGRGARDTYWTWPVWSFPATADVCRSVLSTPELHEDTTDSQSRLQQRGIAAAFLRSRRITVGKFRNFTPAVAVF